MEDKYAYAYIGVFSMIIMLMIQFLLGIYINLYISFPPMNGNYYNAKGIFPAHFILIMVHMMLGIFIMLVAFFILFLSVKIRNMKVIIPALVSLIFIAVAGFAGILFLFAEYNIYSFIMSFSFIVVVIAQFYYLYSLKSFH